VAQTQFVRTIVELLSAFARMVLPVKKIAQTSMSVLVRIKMIAIQTPYVPTLTDLTSVAV